MFEKIERRKAATSRKNHYVFVDVEYYINILYLFHLLIDTLIMLIEISQHRFYCPGVHSAR